MSKSKLALVAIGAAVLIVAGVLLWNEKRSSLSYNSDYEYEKAEDGSRKHSDVTEFYEILTSSPDITPLRQSAGKGKDEAATDLMEQFVKEEVANFKENGDFENLSEEDKDLLGFNDGRKYALNIEYSMYEGKNTVSYLFTIYADTGGAHPNGHFRTFTFNRADGRYLLLEDIFFGNYLEKIASLSRAQVIADIKTQFEGEPTIFEEGFAPNEENYSNFYIEGATLVIVFPPYQIAAYAAGPQKAEIPLATLADYLRAGGI